MPSQSNRDLERNIASQRQEPPSPRHTGKVAVKRHRDGTVTTRVWPSPGVIAVAELLRARYVSEYETAAPLEDWLSDATEIVCVCLEAEGEA